MDTLKKKSEFESVYKYSKKYRDKNIRIYVLKISDTDQSKAAFVVSKKFGNAVKRNRIKRLMREAWRQIPSPEKGYFFVLLPQQGTIDRKSGEIAMSLRRLLEKENILSNI